MPQGELYLKLSYINGTLDSSFITADLGNICGNYVL